MKDNYVIYEDPRASGSTRFAVDNKKLAEQQQKLELNLRDDTIMVKAVLMAELLGKPKARTRQGGRWA